MAEFIANKDFHQEYVYDVAKDGGATGNYDLSAKSSYPALPAGLVVTDVYAWVESSFVGSGASAEWGTLTDTDGFSGAAIAAGTLAQNVVYNGQGSGTIQLIWDNTNDCQIAYRVGATANDQKPAVRVTGAELTAGKLRLIIKGFIPGRDL